MKMLLLSLLVLTACSTGFAVDHDDGPTEVMGGRHVAVHLDGNTGLTTGTLVRLDSTGVIVRLDATGKLYFYPQSRISGIEQL